MPSLSPSRLAVQTVQSWACERSLANVAPRVQRTALVGDLSVVFRRMDAVISFVIKT
jgi:hypothetical protein